MLAGVFRRAPRSLRYLYSQHFPISRDDLCEKPRIVVEICSFEILLITVCEFSIERGYADAKRRLTVDVLESGNFIWN
jgi:hypothetical protein